MNYFPVFMDLHDQPVVLIGAGAVAERKARLLLKAGAKLRVVARELNPAFQIWQANGSVELLAREYSSQQLRCARLVFAATADQALNRRVFEDAESLGIAVNVVDDQARCRFISPAVVDRSPVQIAISTGGASPVLARRIRSWIEAILPLGLGKVARAAGGVRELVKKNIPLSRRRDFWEQVLSDSSLQSWSTGSLHQIKRQMRQLVTQAAVENGQKTRSPGRVYLVGGGPGRADLLTLRALQVLGQADVVLHDSLVSDEVLDLVRRDADRIDVGKRAGGKRHHQDDTNKLMVELAGKGRTVVRLKGGDSFVFGRGGEELEYLRGHGVEYEVVPGITAALGCAAYAGIPLTHRDHAYALTLVTGHTAKAVSQGCSREDHIRDVDWASWAGPGKTAVIYMGVRQAPSLRARLLDAGIGADFPVALIVNGTLENQQVLHGTVDDLPALASRAGTKDPGLLIIGQVAALGSNLGWFSAVVESQSGVFKTAA